VTNEDIMPIRGSCHCGKIAYSLDAEPTEAIECNCSICRRRGSVLAAFAPEQFHLETSRDDIAVYTFGKHVIRHQFCRTCGVRAIRRGHRARWRADGRGQSPLRRRRPFDNQDHTVRWRQPVATLKRELQPGRS
jgi:hypothetical protein